MLDNKIGFIGAGNIAGAIFNGITSSGYIKPQNIYVFDVDSQKATTFSEKGATVVSDLKDISVNCNFIFLTVKPQIYEQVLLDLKNKVPKDVCFIDVAAGISINFVKSVLGYDAPVVRVMPNTPLMYGNGATALVKCEPVTDEQFLFVKGCFDSSGVTCVVDEEYINTVIAISGSAPAYVMRFAKSLINFGIQNGLSKEDSEKLVLQTLIGSAKMINDSDLSVTDLIRMVTSPNGTTERGLFSLDENNFDSILEECLTETVNRAKELSR